MRIRWAIAAVGALALALLTLSVPLPWVSRHPDVSSSNVSCPADAKPANLNFTLKDMTGQEVTLSAYKGKVILLNFWATWCGPCKVEIPWFVTLQTTYGRQGLQVLGVSVDDPVDKLKPFAASLKMNYPVLQGLGHDDVQDAYGPLWGIPVSVVISRDGKICAKHTGVSTQESFEKEIKSLL